jgi:hypothetical protein
MNLNDKGFFTYDIVADPSFRSARMIISKEKIRKNKIKRLFK